MSLVVGGVATAGSIWWCLSSVDGRQIDLQRPDLPDDIGPLPETVRLHARDGIFWLVARDQLRGVYWVNLERVSVPSTNPSLAVELVPRWAEAPTPMQARAIEGPLSRVGTLAVGWPFLCVARQWVEADPTQGFIPQVENDDDGSSTAKAAARFFDSGPNTRAIVLPLGLVGNALFFGVVASPLVFAARRLSKRRNDSSGVGAA